MSTDYVVKHTDEIYKVTIPGRTRNLTHCSLSLLGHGANDYGLSFNENFFHLLENFASDTPPDFPTEGQYWYDKNSNDVFVYDNVSWKRVGGIYVQDEAPTLPEQGDLWWDTDEVDRNVRIYIDGVWEIVVDDYLPRDGHKKMAGDLNFDDNAILNLQQPAPPVSSNNPVDPNQAATTQYVHDVLTDITGDTLTGTLDFSDVATLIDSTFSTGETYSQLQDVDGADVIYLWNAEFGGTNYTYSSSSFKPVMVKIDNGSYDVYHAIDGTQGATISWIGPLSIDTNTMTIDGTIDVTTDIQVDGNITVQGTDILTDANFNTKKTASVLNMLKGMIESNTESGINVTYDSGTDTIDFNADDFIINLTGDLTGSATVTNLGSVTINTTVADDSHTHDIRYYTKAELDALLDAIALEIATTGTVILSNYF